MCVSLIFLPIIVAIGAKAICVLSQANIIMIVPSGLILSRSTQQVKAWVARSTVSFLPGYAAPFPAKAYTYAAVREVAAVSDAFHCSPGSRITTDQVT